MAIMIHVKFHFNRLMLTLIFGIQAPEPPWAWRRTEKAGSDGVNISFEGFNSNYSKTSKLDTSQRHFFNFLRYTDDEAEKGF